MKPVDLRDTIRIVTPKIILFKPTTKTETAIASYDINVLSKYKNMKNFSGKGNVPKLFEWDIQNDPEVLKLKNNLTYKMTVKDTINQTFETKSQEIAVELITVEEKRKNATKDTIINIYNLILFDFNKSTLDPTNKAITDIIKSEIPDNAIVKVTGYTDIIGKEDYNLKLSTERALSTSKALNAKNVKSEGKGEYELLFDNSNPEGRFYCRTVVVEVRIPVN
jgi:outer membrane protein OmpA-like peptidoglycan-associated protein